MPPSIPPEPRPLPPPAWTVRKDTPAMSATPPWRRSESATPLRRDRRICEATDGNLAAGWSYNPLIRWNVSL
jgi:hypothetical protein